MAAKSGREALRGVEVDIVDLIFEDLTSKQWAKWLKAPLESAAATGNRDLAQKLVRAGAEIGDALHQAVHVGNGEIVSDLLESGASIEAKDKNGSTPLHVAAVLGHTEMVQMLLLKGADKDALDNEEMTPLYHAAFSGHVATTLVLLASGVDGSLRCGPLKAPALHIAAEKGHVETVRAMIEHGVDLDAVNQYQETALHEAASYNSTKAIDELVEAGANIEARGYYGGTPLHRASVVLRREALLSLLEHGATVNARNDYRRTPLMRAAARAGPHGAAEVVDYLLRAGADETMVDDDGKKAEGVIGANVEEENRFAEDVERARKLLADAPADRAWRRRGYMVLCRAHPERIQQSQVISTRHAGTGRRARSRAKLARADGVAGESSSGDESTGGDWTVVVAKVLSLQEEGIFRTIVGTVMLEMSAHPVQDPKGIQCRINALQLLFRMLL